MDSQTQAQDAISNLRRRIDNITNDPNLTAQGKRAQAAVAWLQVKKEVDALRDKHEASEARRREMLIDSLIGSVALGDATAMISYRDAAERANRLAQERNDAQTSEDRDKHARNLREALEQAALSGDTHLAKNVLRVAINNSWGDVLDKYVELYPDAKVALDSLLPMLRGRSMQERFFGDAFHLAPFGILEGYGINQIEAYARETH